MNHKNKLKIMENNERYLHKEKRLLINDKYENGSNQIIVQVQV